MRNLELEAMGKVAEVLEGLDEKARSRVIAWVMGALSIEPHSGVTTVVKGFGGAPEPDVPSKRSTEFDTFAEQFHAASPQSEKEKALVAAFWSQQTSGSGSFGSQQINAELRDIGYKIANITDALTQLINEKPALVVQLKKSGSSRQARKTYKITDAGSRRVAEMLKRHPAESE